MLFLRNCRSSWTCRLKERRLKLLFALQNPCMNILYSLKKAISCLEVENWVGFWMSHWHITQWGTAKGYLVHVHGTAQHSDRGPERNVPQWSSSLLHLALQHDYFGPSAGLHWHSHIACSGSWRGFPESVQGREKQNKAALPDVAVHCRSHHLSERRQKVIYTALNCLKHSLRWVLCRASQQHESCQGACNCIKFRFL